MTSSKPYYIAVDFDGTLCTDAFPEIGKPRTKVIKKLYRHIKKLHKRGYSPRLILWTCREDNPDRAYLFEAEMWCVKQGIKFDNINENPEADFGHPELVHKIFANECWDDRAVKV